MSNEHTVNVLRRLIRSQSGRIGLVMVGAILLVALFAPWLAPHNPLAVDLTSKLQAPSAQFLLGTDQAGRDVASRIIWGSRYSLGIALAAVLVGSIVGITMGLIAGYLSGRWVEVLILRTFDLLFSIPMLVLSIAVIGILGTGAMSIGPFSFGNEARLVALIAIGFIPVLGRITHASVLVESKADYVRAKKVLGAGWMEITFIEILPNAIPPALIQASLFVGVAIIVEASLSFIGLGIQPPNPSWGTLLADARSYIFSGKWWLPLFPGLAICLVVVGFNYLGDGLVEAIDPRGGRGVGLV